jgi:hypothetical protein
MNLQISLARHYSSRIFNKSLRATGWIPGLPDGNIRQKLSILSAGYNGNLGDQTLAFCISSQCIEYGYSPVLVDYETVRKPKLASPSLPALMFGGELGDLSHFRSLINIQSDPSSAAIGGISIDKAFFSHPDPELLVYLKRIKSFWVRDQFIAQAAQDKLGLCQVKYAPDIVFSLATSAKPETPKYFQRPTKGKVLGINIQAYFHKMTKTGDFVPLDATPFGSAEETTLAEYSYRQAFYRLIRDYQEQGYTVINYSFSTQDTVYFTRFFHGLGCQLLEFYWNFNGLLQSISQCSLFVASRYHAHIASIIAGLPTISIMVGAKNTGLLRDMGIQPDKHQVSRDLFLCNKDGVDSLMSIDPFIVSNNVVTATSIQAKESIRDIISSLPKAFAG